MAYCALANREALEDVQLSTGGLIGRKLNPAFRFEAMPDSSLLLLRCASKQGSESAGQFITGFSGAAA